MTDLEYGSDVVVQALQRLGIDFATVNPGASFRGMHDSLTHAGTPELIMTLFEGVNIAIAHGYAKATGRPMAAFVHDLVGLQHASMGIFNAWADQVPIMVIGGSGPADASHRRPWIDWIHSIRWQGLQVREYTKWDDEPTSVAAFPDSLLRAHRIATAMPPGPTYVAFDAGLQEQPAGSPDLSHVRPGDPATLTAPLPDLQRVADALVAAENPVIISDFTGRSERAYRSLIELADLMAAPVIDMGARHNFPTTHWAHATPERAAVLDRADLVLALDVRDVRFAVSELLHAEHSYRRLISPGCAVYAIGLNDLQPSGFMDREPVFDGEASLVADTAVALPTLVELVRPCAAAVPRARREALQTVHAARRPPAAEDPQAMLSPTGLARAVGRAVADHDWLLANGHLRGAVQRTWSMDRWNCYLGTSGGGGLGYGIGASIGAALAHRDDDVLVVNIQPDGDALYTPSGLWTAAHHRLPLLTVVANNRTYGQDRMHQRNIGEQRGRDPRGVPIGIDIDDPAVDFATLAESQGVEGFGVIESGAEFDEVIGRAVQIVAEETRPVLVDVRISR